MYPTDVLVFIPHYRCSAGIDTTACPKCRGVEEDDMANDLTEKVARAMCPYGFASDGLIYPQGKEAMEEAKAAIAVVMILMTLGRDVYCNTRESTG